MTTWKTFRTPEVPHPFALSIASDDLVIISGLGGEDETGEFPDDVVQQTRNAITQMKGLLEQAGSSLDEIVYFRPYVTAREHAFTMDDVLREILPDPKPASGALVICDLAHPAMYVEFEALAVRGARLE